MTKTTPINEATPCANRGALKKPLLRNAARAINAIPTMKEMIACTT
jgi:hypothetical protein